MKKHIKIIALFSIVAAALIAVPAISRAQDASAGQTTPKPNKHGLPFHGSVSGVDTNAMTLTVASLTLNVTSETKISKDGKPAILADLAVGDKVRGDYKKDDDGKLNATVIREGKNPKGGKKKKAAAPAPPAPN